jgi:hypothetical protein
MNVDLSKFDSVFSTIQENAILQTQLLSSISNKSEETMELTLLGFAAMETLMNQLLLSFKGTKDTISNMFQYDNKSVTDSTVSNQLKIMEDIKNILSSADMNDNNETLKSIQSALETNQSSSETLKSIQSALETNQSSSDVLQSIQSALETNQSSSETLKSIQSALETNQSSSDVLQSIQSALETNQSSSDVLQSIQSALETNQSSSETLKLIQSALETNQSSSETLQSIQNVLETNQSSSETLKSIQSALETNQSSSETNQSFINDEGPLQKLMYTKLESIESILNSSKNSSDKLYEILKETLDFEKEKERDEAREKEKDKVRKKELPESDMSSISKFFSELTDKLFGQVQDISGFDLVKVGILAPLLFEFVKAFVNRLTDGLFEGLEFFDIPKAISGLVFWQTLGPNLVNSIGKSLRGLYNFIINTSTRIAKIADTISDFVKGVGSRITTGFAPIRQMFTNLGRIFQPIINFAGEVAKFVGGAMGKTLSFFGSVSGITTLLKTIGKVFKPLGVLISAFDGFKAFTETEGTFLEKLGAGIGQFLGSFVGTILDLIKNVGAWIVGKLGFSRAANFLREFSFERLIRNTVEGFFGMVSGAVEWVKTLFTDPVAALNSLWKTALGTYKSFLDIIFWPIDKAVQWISGIFGWEEGESFSLTDLIWDAVGGAITWVKTLFTNPMTALNQFWNALVGEGGLLDLLWMPVNLVVDWVTKKFGWRDEDAPTFSIKDKLIEWGTSLMDWLTGFLPSFEDIRDSLLAKMPNWMRKLVGAPEQSAEEIVAGQVAANQSELESIQQRMETAPSAEEQRFLGRLFGGETQESLAARAQQLEAENAALTSGRSAEEIVARQALESLQQERQAFIESAQMSGIDPDTSDFDRRITEIIENINSYSKGSPGFVDFGDGTPAMLHGPEAVVPRDTPAGDFLDSFFDENWQPKIASMLETIGMTPSIEPIMVPVLKQNYVANAGEAASIEQRRSQAAIMNVMPQMVSSRPVTNNNSSTTIINNISPARVLDDPSMLR